jgi:tetratricopeptide (TPR) repeat protein
MLAKARRTGDRRREIIAITDLGIVFTRIVKTDHAISILEEALALVRPMNDRALESDVLDNLGLAVLQAVQPRRALELFEPVLEYARAACDRLAEKMALFHLSLAYTATRDFDRAQEHLDEALAIARQINDAQNEAELLSQLAIIHAETGKHDQAVTTAEKAVSLYEQTGNPQVAWLKANLEKYRAGLISVPVVSPSELSSLPIFGGQIVAGGWTGVQLSQGQGVSGPGLLRMAFSAMTSIAHFTRAGFKTTPSETYHRRLEMCSQCAHHTGMRCRICGCFTNVKALMPHEACPIGKWASSQNVPVGKSN